ncbi:hypothetical protein [Neisseria animalis]|uniref:Thiosulfate sulfur transferase n=1 Tax=Neisseria animalis TaxID=492 RepID=A0A5P3MSJ5_NEIAN|nr:hypothetical protein [Neisseria animalis]QEY24587.1 hypothetical protein D0T90_09025 [Neisseria animalis]ROW33125.1 hypothetical protein CGZ60_01700 [Neisseria animalis]VEE07427.1 thiosulfate sulfur transferase [Neisseria animalis]
MKAMKTTAALVAATVLLNGCTWMMWGMNDPFGETTTFPLVGKDNIHAFGTVKESTAQLERGSLVMMGGKYWFIVNPADSAKLVEILNIKLDKQFQMVQHNPRYRYEALPVTLKKADSAEFSSNFCLRYDTEKASEIKQLQALSFKETKIDKQTAYVRCIEAAGKYYNVPQQMKADYRFDQSVPVAIRYEVTTKQTDYYKLTSNIIMTPLTLAGDAAVAVTAIALSPLNLLVKAVGN